MLDNYRFVNPFEINLYLFQIILLTMKTIFIFIICLEISLVSFSQQNGIKPNSIKLTAGRIIFGTGDIFGYAVNVEYAKFLKHNSAKHFSFGAELSFENGSTHPVVINPTIQEFLFGSRYQATTVIALTPKLTYYPFNKTFARGLNITGGLSLAYVSHASEFEATRVYDSIGQRFIRRSYLEFHNKTTIGYRITAGYEWFFAKIIIGARLDFDSYHNGDINTFYGLKAGFRF
jgi:hypothetical protein